MAGRTAKTAGRTKKHLILFLAANPNDTNRFRHDEECAEIQRQLKQAPYRDDFHFESRWAVSIDELLSYLRELDPSVLHFSCHGTSEGLVLQNEDGGSKLLKPYGLGKMIKAATSDLRLLVLNACHSSSHTKRLRNSADCVVGMDGAIRDFAACVFATHFYAALGCRRSIGNAIDAACAALAAEELPDEWLPRWATRDKSDPNTIVLDPVSPEPSASGSPGLRRDEQDPPNESPNLGTHTFVGRDGELSQIETILTGSETIQLHVALHGLPGIGKTELARQVVARLSRDKRFPGGIFWFTTETPDLRLQWAKIADRLGAPGQLDLDGRIAWAVKQIEGRAQRGDGVLVVLDNVQSWTTPPSPLPDASATRLLVTTQVRWLHNSFRSYEVPPLEVTHARELLHAIVGRDVPDTNELLDALGGHVLSIELAATYLREYAVPPREYLKQLLKGSNPGDHIADRTSYRATARSAFGLLWHRLPDELRAAWHRAAQLPAVWFSSELADAIGLDAVHRGGLVRLHILERDGEGRHQMHRLLREFALAEAPSSHTDDVALITSAICLLGEGDPSLLFRRYTRDAASYDHLLDRLSGDPLAASLRAVIGRALHQLGDLRTARTLHDQVFAFTRDLYGDDHPETTMARARLAGVLQDLGNLSAAYQLFEQAFNSAREAYGDDHPAVATRLANLAGVLRRLGDLPRARKLYEQALNSARMRYGEDHPVVATRRANLAVLLQQLGDLPAARALFEQALASDLRTYGDHHPEVAATRANLARLFQQLGDLPAARTLFEQALESDLMTYGDVHPTVAIRRASLAGLLHEQGELSAARPLLEQSLISDLKTYGEEHSVVASRRANLAGLLREQGELSAARHLYEQALASDLKTYGDDHPTIAIRRSNLAMLLRQLDELAAAQCLFEQALASLGKSYGDDHPTAAAIRASLAAVLRQRGDAPAARRLFEQALTSLRKIYPDNHPDIATIHAKLGELAQEQEHRRRDRKRRERTT